MKKTYTVLEQFRIGQRWQNPNDSVSLTDAEAQYPLSRGWIKPAKTTASKRVKADAAE